MRKPEIDYRTFRLSRLNDPQFAHLKLLGGWIGYFIMYFLTENLIPEESCHVVHCWIDDLIPFCEWFLIPYVFWYFLIVFTLLYLMLYHVEGFKRFQIFIIVTQVVAMAIYIIYPNRQDMRPEDVSKWFKAFIIVAVVFICLATMFIKQHSAVDFFVALPVCLLAEEIAYGKSYWAVRRKRRHSVT